MRPGLETGVNVDPVDIPAGLAEFDRATGGKATAREILVVEYALMRWARGEEGGADRTIRTGKINFTTWRRALAAALAAGAANWDAEHPQPLLIYMATPAPGDEWGAHYSAAAGKAYRSLEHLLIKLATDARLIPDGPGCWKVQTFGFPEGHPNLYVRAVEIHGLPEPEQEET